MEASDTLAPLSALDIRTSIRPTLAEIDLGAVQRNFRRVREAVGPRAAIWGVVKADAYGHGAVAVGRALEPLCNALAVSLVEEGMELRAAGVRAPILVLGAYYDNHHADVLAHRLTPVVYELGELERFAAAAERRGRRADVHVKIDTGMSRLGLATAEVPRLLARAGALPSLRLAGLCTHLASADLPDGDVTREALARFDACVAAARAEGFVGLVNHAANSAAAVRFPEARFDAVRPGLALYGAMPSPYVALAGLEPALRLTTRVMAVHDIAPGATVSYGGLWRAPRPSRVATLPIGYADGYPRHVRDARALVRGRRVPVVGAVCMDMLMVDVTDVPAVRDGDLVTLIGADGGEVIGVDDLAAWAGTVSYEILCGISKRVPRALKDAAVTSTTSPGLAGGRAPGPSSNASR
ncbi:MAG TPA: alanine racemase [Polyangia bacterium]|nr:alanine racemase [Polyangia bacterium]